jgi:hypothetical protein
VKAIEYWPTVVDTRYSEHLYLKSTVLEEMGRIISDVAKLVGLLREAREALRLSGRNLANADIPWPFEDDILSRIDAALKEAGDDK